MLYREVDAQCDKLAKVVRRVRTVTVYRIHTHIHTSKSAPRSGYLTFNGPLSGTTRVSRYQKGKTNLDFTGARDSEWQWHQLGRMQVCTLLQADYHASTPPLSFLQAGCPSGRPTISIKALFAAFVSYHMAANRARGRSLLLDRGVYTLPLVGQRSSDERVCVSVYLPMSQRAYLRNCTSNLHPVLVHDSYGRRSAVFWQCCGMLSASSFVDDRTDN